MYNKDFLIRLLKYKRILEQFHTMGLEKVFSNNLGDALGISAALVRKDFSRMEFGGNKRGGYNIAEIMEKLNDFLGSETMKDVVLVGCGNLGTALINHEAFKKDGIHIVAGFDLKPETAEINSVPIYPMEVLNDFVKEYKVDVGIICTPASAANQVKEMMILSGISGILNFAPVELKTSDECLINNVNIGLELENLFFHINNPRIEHKDES